MNSCVKKDNPWTGNDERAKNVRMQRPEPDFAEVMRVISVYLQNAYPGDLPPAVKKVLLVVENAGNHICNCSAMVPDPRESPTRYLLRLGNQFYPHMKLVIELAPDGSRFLYRADTHDQHICPSESSPEYSAFCDLMEKNQRVAAAIDTAWEQAAVPTFKSYLRDDLRRRKAAMDTVCGG